MTFSIREATEADIPAMARIQTELNPNHPYSADTFAREMQEARGEGMHEAYWVAEQGGAVVAYANVAQHLHLHHPERYFVYLQVLPGGRKQGIGSALAGQMRDHLQTREAREVIAGAYENDEAAPILMTRYGFTEVQRYFDSHLNITEFDFPAWEGKEVVPGGMRVVSFADLSAELGQEAACRVYYDVYRAAVPDVPAPVPRTLSTFERFSTVRLGQPDFQPGSVFLALAPDGQAAAFTELWAWEDDPRRWKIGITAVRREWRRHGLALALKLRGMQAARDAGIGTITTNAESGNTAMLRLNERLGFTNDTAWVEYKWGNV